MEMLIKQGFLFVRVMTGEITDGSIIPHKHSPSGAETNALCLFSVALHFVFCFFFPRDKRGLWKLRKWFSDSCNFIVWWHFLLMCIIICLHWTVKTQIFNHQSEMIDGFIKRLKNRESLWRRVKKVTQEISMNAARKILLLLSDRRGRWAAGSRIT